MQIAPTKGLEGLILQSLAAVPRVTVKQLSRAVSGYSMQAIYQALRKLEQNGAVVRRGGYYSLRYLWISQLLEFARQSHQNYLEREALVLEIPAIGDRTRWTCSSLKQLLDLWTDLVFVLLKRSETRTVFEAVSHVWFHIANPINEEHVVRELGVGGASYYLVSGGSSYLDRTYEPLLKKMRANYSFGKKGFPLRENQYFSLVDNLVIDVRLSRTLNRDIAVLYSQSKRSTELEFAERLSSAQGRCVLSISHDPKRASRERLKFEKFFGIVTAEVKRRG